MPNNLKGILLFVYALLTGISANQSRYFGKLLAADVPLPVGSEADRILLAWAGFSVDSKRLLQRGHASLLAVRPRA